MLVEDTPSLARVYTEYLKKAAFAVTAVETGAAALDILRDAPPEVVLLDLQLPDINGMEILKYVSGQQIPTAVVIITAHASVNVAVEAMRYGAYDFVVKPFTADRLMVTVRNAVERLRLAQIVDTYAEELARSRFHGFIGSSLRDAGRLPDHRQRRVQPGDRVHHRRERHRQGSLRAEAIHRQSPRRDSPFVAINCGAIPKELMESEIFGHVKGAFTGAVADREGAAARANGGTLFLDEICEMDAGAADQAAALPPDRHLPAGRRHQARQGRRADPLRHQPRPAGARSRPAGSARTCTTGCTSSRPPAAAARPGRRRAV